MTNYREGVGVVEGSEEGPGALADLMIELESVANSIVFRAHHVTRFHGRRRFALFAILV